MRLCLVEDGEAARLAPLSLTRPVFDLMLGQTTLGAKLTRAFGVGPGPARRGAWIRPHLVEIQQERDPRTKFNDRDWLARGPVWVVNARWVPPLDFEPPTLGAPWIGFCEGRPACALVGPDLAVGLEAGAWDLWFEALAGEPSVDHLKLDGDWVGRPEDLIHRNAEHLDRDFNALGYSGASNRQLATLALIGPADRLFIHETARIDPYTVFDTTAGSISIGPGAWVQPFSRLEGPCAVGPRSQLQRAELRGGVTIGPGCQVQGEIVSSILHGFTKKDQNGRLSHAYIGEWVHLAAESTSPIPIGPRTPGALTLEHQGCFIGDHSRIGSGNLLEPGTSIGLMCELATAAGLSTKDVPCFTRTIRGRLEVGAPLESLFVMARKLKDEQGQRFSANEEQLYRTLFEQTHFERRRAFRQTDDLDNDRWAPAAGH